MIAFLKELNKEFKSLCNESYLNENNSNIITFPYLTYSLQGDDLEDREGFYIDVDIYDKCGSNTINLEVLQHKIITYFKRYNKIFAEFAMNIVYQNSNTIPTLDEEIKHRHVQLYAKVDWRR